MFNTHRVLIDAFVDRLRGAFRELFPGLDGSLEATLERSARTALETLRNCDCPYHDLEHTLLVTDAGLAVLHGRQLARGDLTARSWLQAVVALLFHDVGYRRGLLQGDRDGACVADETGRLVTPPAGATDAFLMPYHVSRSSMFVLERYANDPHIDGPGVASYIEMTRFPVPSEAGYQQLDSLGALVRAADLIGQMADPAYPLKLVRLFAEFVEVGEAARLGYESHEELRADFPHFFYRQVYPYLPVALDYLGRTDAGEKWIASLVRHLHGHRIGHRPATGAARLPVSLDALLQGEPPCAEPAPAPRIAISNP